MQPYVQFAAFYKKNVEDFEPLAAVIIPDNKPAHLRYSFLPMLNSRSEMSSCEVRAGSGCLLDASLWFWQQERGCCGHRNCPGYAWRGAVIWQSAISLGSVGKSCCLWLQVLFTGILCFKNTSREKVLKFWNEIKQPSPPPFLVSKFTFHCSCFFSLNFYQSCGSKYFFLIFCYIHSVYRNIPVWNREESKALFNEEQSNFCTEKHSSSLTPTHTYSPCFTH